MVKYRELAFETKTDEKDKTDYKFVNACVTMVQLYVEARSKLIMAFSVVAGITTLFL